MTSGCSCKARWLPTHHDKPQERIPLSKQKEFRQIKNAVIQEVERLHLGEIGFEEKGLNQQDEPEGGPQRLLRLLDTADVIRDESLTMEERGEAVSEMERLAESGDMYAQYLMGKLWRDGPLLIPDSVEARYWFEQAADQGHLVAQYSLAKLYLSDDLEVRDTRKGMNWLYTAAVNGSHYAMYRLAKECLKGEHIQRIPQERWRGLPSRQREEIPTPSICWASYTLLVRRFPTTRRKPHIG